MTSSFGTFPPELSAVSNSGDDVSPTTISVNNTFKDFIFLWCCFTIAKLVKIIELHPKNH